MTLSAIAYQVACKIRDTMIAGMTTKGALEALASPDNGQSVLVGHFSRTYKCEHAAFC